jgi:tetratricopeptide (TPR) repeat protein
MQDLFRILLLTLVATSALAQQSGVSANSPQAASSVAPSVSASPWLNAVSRAREMVANNPQDAVGYVALGYALCHQAQETVTLALYTEADQALNRALQISPNNFEARKAQVCVELGRHEFARAREHAMILNKRMPDDIMVYGLLVDANSALGNYPEAENAAQWMLNLRPGNTPAFLHAADLREVFGEQQGALQLLKLVLDSSSPADVSGRAAVLTQMARINLEIGDLTSGQALAVNALSLQANDPRANLVMAQLRQLQGKPEDAIPLIRASYQALPTVQTLYALACAMQEAGMREEARNTFAQFEQKALEQSSHPDNANRELIFYYTDHANNPVKALSIAELEVAHRHDVFSLDAYAWALCKNGRYADAKKQMDTALKVGVREAPIFYHAGEIESQLGNITEARRMFTASVELKSFRSQDADVALASLRTEKISPK